MNKYSKTKFEGFTHRFKVRFSINHDLVFETGLLISTIDIYSNSEKHQELADFIYEKQSDKVISFEIIHRASKEEDEMTAKLIDEVMKDL